MKLKLKLYPLKRKGELSQYFNGIEIKTLPTQKEKKFHPTSMELKLKPLPNKNSKGESLHTFFKSL